MEKQPYLPLDQATEKSFLPYHGSYRFGDHTFSLLYAWQNEFQYQYFQTEGALVVRGFTRRGERAYLLLRQPDNAALGAALRHIADDAAGSRTAMVCYVGEEELPAYEAAAGRLGYGMTSSFDPNYSDYIYQASSFVSLAGKRQKSVRGDFNFLLRTATKQLHYVAYRPELLPACVEIFDSWCATHACAQCRFGCERTAFLRFMEVFDESRCFAALSYDGDEAISFAAGEIINPDTACYYFQKNKRRIRGLMYWLNREIALRQPEIAWINLAEDIGLEGIRRDKERLHPCCMQKKCVVTLKLE